MAARCDGRCSHAPVSAGAHITAAPATVASVNTSPQIPLTSAGLAEKMSRVLFQGRPVPVPARNSDKMRDFKPMLGLLFEDVLADYAYWGHVDNDVLLGDVRSFLEAAMDEGADIITPLAGQCPAHATVASSPAYALQGGHSHMCAAPHSNTNLCAWTIQPFKPPFNPAPPAPPPPPTPRPPPPQAAAHVCACVHVWWWWKERGDSKNGGGLRGG